MYRSGTAQEPWPGGRAGTETQLALTYQATHAGSAQQPQGGGPASFSKQHQGPEEDSLVFSDMWFAQLRLFHVLLDLSQAFLC